MSEHKAKISWNRETEDYKYDTYNRKHSWSFDSGIKITASAAPDFNGDVDCIDPEEALVAALSSCHMLTFLALSAKKRLVVDSYEDKAVGFLEKNSDGKLILNKVILRPKITFAPEVELTKDDISKMHEKAHSACFIANSVKTTVQIEST